MIAALMMGVSAASWMPPRRVNTDQIRLLACAYQGAKLASSVAFENGRATLDGSEWACERRATKDGFEATFHLTKGQAASSGVAVAFDLARWSRSDYLLIPASVYNGNRFHALGGEYMPPFPRSMFFDPRLPLTISNNPRLAIEKGTASRIELLTGNASTPAICVFSPATHRGKIVLFEQGTRFGNSAVFVEENAEQDRATLVVSAPGVREHAAGFGGFFASEDKGAAWDVSDSLTLRFKVYDFNARSIPDLLDRFLTLRKAMTGPNHPRDFVPFSAMRDAIIPRIRSRWNGKYFLPENSPDFQLGWVSGFMQTPLLATHNRTDRERICEQLDFVTSKLEGKSGFFHAGITAKGELRADRSLDGRRFVLTRKNGDTLLMYSKFIRILRVEGHGDLVKPEWVNAARRLADAFVQTWDKFHEFGQYLDPETGEIAVFNSTGGAVVPGALALASQTIGDPAYLRVAKAAGNFYFERDVRARGLTAGACGDISQDPDSETAFGFLESTLDLYWATGDRAWLEKARATAALCATWVLSYDYRFPANSDIGKLGASMAGAVFASAQNKHAAPGICTSSGDSLFKLFRATGDRRYAELIRDIQHAHTEATEMPGHPTCGAGTGASMERIQPTDAEGKGAIGNFVQTENAWCELDGLMMATELPGIYFRTDTGKLFTFDHMRAKAIRTKSGWTLEITNPTHYDARVSIFAEAEPKATHPLDPTTYLKWPTQKVPAGQTARFEIDESSTRKLCANQIFFRKPRVLAARFTGTHGHRDKCMSGINPTSLAKQMASYCGGERTPVRPGASASREKRLHRETRPIPLPLPLL